MQNCYGIALGKLVNQEMSMLYRGQLVQFCIIIRKLMTWLHNTSFVHKEARLGASIKPTYLMEPKHMSTKLDYLFMCVIK